MKQFEVIVICIVNVITGYLIRQHELVSNMSMNISLFLIMMAIALISLYALIKLSSQDKIYDNNQNDNPYENVQDGDTYEFKK